MPHFAIRYSVLTGKSSVHAETCPEARKRACVTTTIEAPTARQAQTIFAAQEELIERGLPIPTICHCANHG